LHGWADRYWQEYEGLSNDWRGSAEAYLLLCRAIELEFKAWHRQAGRTDGLIDRVRHDLMASYRALPKKHQTLSLDEVDLLTKAGDAYTRAGLRAFEPGAADRAREPRRDPVKFEALTRKVLEYGDELALSLW
jgi:hypothetical protein